MCVVVTFRSVWPRPGAGHHEAAGVDGIDARNVFDVV